jgi:hypothetical protein
LRPLDKALLLILVPVWAACFALGVKTQFHSGGTCDIGLSVADAESYPMLTGEFGADYPSNPLDEARLRAGDLLVRAGRADLRGVGTLGFRAISEREAGRNLDIPVVYERKGERFETSLALLPASVVLPWVGISFSFAASALFLLLRAPPTRSVRAYFLAGFCLAIGYCYFHGGGLLYAWVGIFTVANGLLYPLWLRLAQVFPDDVVPEGRWHRIWPWVFTILGLFQFLYHAGGWFTVGWVGLTGTHALGLAALLALFSRKYRRLDPVARRQVKWVLFGLYCAALPVLVTAAIGFFEPRIGPYIHQSMWAASLFPAALIVSVARYNLFDIDRLISGTASYTILVILLALGGEILLEPLAARVASSVGLHPGAGQVAFVVVLAALLIPAQRSWRPYVDRIFFAHGRSLAASVEELLEEISDTTAADAVMQRTGAGIERAFHPEFVAIYRCAGHVFEPTYVAGSSEFPALPTDSQGIRMLESKPGPIHLDPRGAAPTSPDPIDSLVSGAAVIMPLRCEGAPNAFVGIGPKRSGDVYTSTDLSLLSAVAHGVSARLERSISEGCLPPRGR